MILCFLIYFFSFLQDFHELQAPQVIPEKNNLT